MLVLASHTPVSRVKMAPQVRPPREDTDLSGPVYHNQMRTASTLNKKSQEKHHMQQTTEHRVKSIQPEGSCFMAYHYTLLHGERGAGQNSLMTFCPL